MLKRLGSTLPIGDIAAAARLLWNLPAFIGEGFDPVRARRALQDRRARRSDSFLAQVRRGIYEHPGSPYLQLLKRAGCELGDLKRLVARDGLEGALGRLFDEGVYLTVDELKGNRAAVRGRSSIAIDPARLANPATSAHVPLQSSGSRGARRPVAYDLAYGRAVRDVMGLGLEASGGRSWRHAAWTVPGGAGLGLLIAYRCLGVPMSRWFTQLDPSAPGLHPRYRWSQRALRWGSALTGTRLPRPELVRLEDPLPIARWMAEVLRRGQVPSLHTFCSPAVRLCRAAAEAGLELRGARFTLGGEPLTATRLELIHRVGAEAATNYGTMEVGLIAERHVEQHHRRPRTNRRAQQGRRRQIARRR